LSANLAERADEADYLVELQRRVIAQSEAGVDPVIADRDHAVSERSPALPQFQDIRRIRQQAAIPMDRYVNTKIGTRYANSW
jgi:hypothetical protein